MFWRDRASHTLSRELSATAENYCSSTLFDYISKFGRICTDKMCAYICICKDKILYLYLPRFEMSAYILKIQGRGRDSQVRGMQRWEMLAGGSIISKVCTINNNNTNDMQDSTTTTNNNNNHARYLAPTSSIFSLMEICRFRELILLIRKAFLFTIII